jgi:hypothetical protein
VILPVTPKVLLSSVFADRKFQIQNAKLFCAITNLRFSICLFPQMLLRCFQRLHVVCLFFLARLPVLAQA